MTNREHWRRARRRRRAGQSAAAAAIAADAISHRLRRVAVRRGCCSRWRSGAVAANAAQRHASESAKSARRGALSRRARRQQQPLPAAAAQSRDDDSGTSTGRARWRRCPALAFRETGSSRAGAKRAQAHRPQNLRLACAASPPH